MRELFPQISRILQYMTHVIEPTYKALEIDLSLDTTAVG